MPKAGFIANKLKPWIEARERFHLSHAQVQMARELGMNPNKLGKIANHRQELWKLPLPPFIEHCYEKQFHRKQPQSSGARKTRASLPRRLTCLAARLGAQRKQMQRVRRNEP